jgi:hypothetical protein
MTCKAKLYIADDYGDNVATIRCQLSSGHEGPHLEEFERRGKPVKIEWECDDDDQEQFCRID